MNRITMKSSPPLHRFAPDPAALAQGHRALTRARRWTIVGVSLSFLTLAALALLGDLPRPKSDVALMVLFAIALFLARLTSWPASSTQPSTDLRPRASLPSAGLDALLELLECACARLERGQHAVFDLLHMAFLYDELDLGDRAWLDARGVPRSRLFDAANNWADADDLHDPELCRALHREVSLMVAAMLDREHEDPYRAGLRSRGVVHLIGVGWLQASKASQDAALRYSRWLGGWAVSGAILGSLAVAAVAGLTCLTEPLTTCRLSRAPCRSAFGSPQQEYMVVVLVALAPLVVWCVAAAHRLVARRSFAAALPALALAEPGTPLSPEFSALRERLARRERHQRWRRAACSLLIPLLGLVAALILADELARVPYKVYWHNRQWLYFDLGRAEAALMTSTIAALLLASIGPARRGHQRLSARMWLGWLRRRRAGDVQRDDLLATLVHHRIDFVTSLANRRESLDVIADVLASASFRDRDAVLEQIEQARARAWTLDRTQLCALEDTLIACERTLADDRVTA
jgi:hypothetical protein